MPCLACDGTVYLVSEPTGHSVSNFFSFPYVSIVVWLIGNLLFTFVLIRMSGRWILRLSETWCHVVEVSFRLGYVAASPLKIKPLSGREISGVSHPMRRRCVPETSPAPLRKPEDCPGAVSAAVSCRLLDSRRCSFLGLDRGHGVKIWVNGTFGLRRFVSKSTTRGFAKNRVRTPA